MNVFGRGRRIRIYIGELDKIGDKPLYEQIVMEAQRQKMAGATVIRGVMGFGEKSHMHSSKLLSISDNLPLIIEIVDTPEKAGKFVFYLKEVVKDGLITVEDVEVLIKGGTK